MANSIHISPRDSVIIVGPKIVSQCRRPQSGCAGPITHREAYKEAWRLAGEQSLNGIYDTAYECDPRSAFERVMGRLNEMKLFTTWCQSVFEASDSDLHVPGCLFSMVSMVERGARLATTTLPPVLSKCLRMPSASLHDVDQVQQWITQPSSQYLLHIGGTGSQEQGWMDPLLPPTAVSQTLGVFFARKQIILIGFEEDVLDYSLLAFLNTLAPLQGPSFPSIVMLSHKMQVQFPLPVPVFTLKMDPAASDSDYLKGTLVGMLWWALPVSMVIELVVLHLLYLTPILAGRHGVSMRTVSYRVMH